MSECRNPLCVQNHNLVYWLNKYFADNPDEKIGCKELMDLQAAVWKEVKKELKIKLED